MNKLFNVSLAIACIFAASAVLLGAFAAHGLQSVLNENALNAFKTGVLYQFLHALALAITAILALHFNSRLLTSSVILFTVGIICFSGSIYLLTLFSIKSIALLTPLGGLLFVIGWLCLTAFAFIAKK
ncbi:DUF423 domain-containing protein [Catenovulum sp. 2E275]|uniref:DUF423 domain-containing protein n=1 Tax=Catenovulum sp. 2E275 TaxID=2980497 RepID=UPI0021D2939B|nr:DUF423 domain-containing protein [Catenovulum sp. 2E275]MCU4674613.1 DUF423 domain-containing protein [Catenovulum sp. 2E275]